MNLSLSNFLFLSKYVSLPLSALKVIEQNKSHSFHKINELKIENINRELKILHKKSGISINKITEKGHKMEKLLKEDIIETINENIKDWKEKDIIIIPYFDETFPIRLKRIRNPPKVIFIKGDFNFDYTRAISIIGTRNPTNYGSEMAKKIGFRFAELGFTIVNGFAKGVDTEALKGGIEAGGKIIGVLGSGLNNPYPKENLNLFSNILKNNNGAFISEQLPNNSVTKSYLVTRNRISSALCIGNVFIEGRKNSGTKWQLKFGKEQKKPIIILKPQKDVKQAELPNEIIKNEINVFKIENLTDIDKIVEKILDLEEMKDKFGKKKNIAKQKFIQDF